MNKRLKIISIGDIASQGVSEPYLCGGEDGEDYFVKGLRSGRHSQINEWICANIAHAVGLPIASFCLLETEEELFEELFRQTFENFSTTFSDGLKKADKQGLRQLLNSIFVHIKHDKLHYKLLVITHLKCEYTEENKAIMAVQKKYLALWEEQLREIVLRCTARNELPGDLHIDLAITYLRATICGLMEMWLHEDDLDLEAVVPPIIDTAIYTLQHSPTLRLPKPNSAKHAEKTAEAV